MKNGNSDYDYDLKIINNFLYKQVTLLTIRMCRLFCLEQSIAVKATECKTVWFQNTKRMLIDYTITSESPGHTEFKSVEIFEIGRIYQKL